MPPELAGAYQPRPPATAGRLSDPDPFEPTTLATSRLEEALLSQLRTVLRSRRWALGPAACS